MRTLVTGAGGILGRQLQERRPAGFELCTRDRAELDVTDHRAVRACIREERPQVVLHAAAMTAVDACETEVERAFAVNALGTLHVAEACHDVGALLVMISTDYVFDGTSARPYRETDPARPLSIYGQSKWQGEQAVRAHAPRHLIVRTQWLYGPGGPNFVDTMLGLADAGRPLRVVADQVGCPTSTADLADALYRLIASDPAGGTYHVSSEGGASWYDFAREIFRLSGASPALSPCTTDQYPRPAPRPAFGVLDNWRLRQAGLEPMPHWREGLRRFLEDR